MQCSGVNKMFKCLCNVRVLIQCPGADAMLSVYAIFSCLCNVLMLRHCSGDYAFSGVDKMSEC